ncbi:hypothetical protein QNO21_05000 [Microbacterium sp. zg-Y818]|uniref:hypothetical protein n=1 Tax=unclassified Microbacterium TaxID=2609290 RepID=UPI00214CAA10|nr:MULTISPECIES: hypothetical protein [unclassified Microbacterium]MCR2800669.1 hypothetical protein [Microbacterium sp. zg.Y818]WIM23393.1 hypothetical protein QNO21_05000 [Microbacterium sp. zg-Y818]
MLAAILLAGFLAAGPSPAGVCDSASNLIDACTRNTGSSVEIGADYTAGGGGGGGGGGNQGGAVRPEVPAPGPAPVCNTVVGCRGGYQVWTPPEVTISDLAAFTPARPSFTAEPDGVAVRGMPANFVAAATEQHIAGELFDYPVVVRFVPAAFVFHYGDGSSRTSSTGGASWPTLGQAQFTPTATSHAYGERGDYAASVTVRYAASVDFGTGSWREVPGFVDATAGGYAVRVVEVHTALVDRTCLEDPRGPGC